jgi:hypothetical protein
MSLIPLAFPDGTAVDANTYYSNLADIQELNPAIPRLNIL